MYRECEHFWGEPGLGRLDPVDLDHDLFLVVCHSANRSVPRIPRLSLPANGVSALEQVYEPQLPVPLTLAGATVWMLHEDQWRGGPLIG